MGSQTTPQTERVPPEQEAAGGKLEETASADEKTLDMDDSKGDGTRPKESATAAPPLGKLRARLPFKRKAAPSPSTPPGRGKKPPGPKPVKFREMFRFATKGELCLNAVGLFCAILAGAATPLMTLMYGNMARALVEYGIARQAGSGKSAEELAAAGRRLIDAASTQALSLMGIGIGMFLATYGFMLIWTYTSERQSMRIRQAYLQSVLRQEIAFFDDFGAGALAARIQMETHLVQVAISEKVPIIVQVLSTFVTGYCVAYARNPRIAGVLTVLLPVQLIVGSTMGKLMPAAMMRALGFVAKAGSVAEEAISSIRTVHAFDAGKAMGKRFDERAMAARNAGIKIAVIQGCGVGMTFFMSYIAYSIGFAYGGRLVSEGKTDVGQVVNCLMAILMGTFAISSLAPEMQHIFKGRAAAAKLWETMARQPVIDSGSADGLKPDITNGEITLTDVHFAYPSRPQVPVLRGLSATFEAGKTTALVGPSGSGKSTVVALLERFYDPISGSVAIDGVRVADMNVRALRGSIGLVSQEPVLFAASIRENVEMGLVGTPHEHADDATKLQMVKDACAEANATFVEQLPNGYDTQVGERGGRLSGGQRQRIAIARAIISNPRILLLDEATSALDARAERSVQEALDRAAKGRTTIAIAHRLATVRDADKILVIADGTVVESGTHTELLELGGVYSELVMHQRLEGDKAAGAVDGETSGTQSAAESVHEAEELAAAVCGPTLAAGAKKDKAFGLWGMTRRVLGLNKDMWGWYALCFTGATINGMAFPVFAILLGMTISDFENPPMEVRRALETKAIYFFVVALVAGISVMCEILGSQKTGWELSRKLRSAAFAALILRPISFFDKDENGSGALVSRVSDGPEKIQGMFGVTLGAALKAFVTIIGGCIVGLAYAPLLALVGIATVPLVFCAGYVRLRVVVLAAVRTQALHRSSAQLATEAVGAVKTVAALTRETDVLARYTAQLKGAGTKSTQTSLRSGALYAASQSMQFFSLAVVFYAGATFVSQGRYDTQSFFTGLTAVVMAAVNAGAVFGFVPDAGQAAAAARSVFGLIDGKPAADGGNALEQQSEKQGSHIELKDVHFFYPSNSNPVLRGLDMDIAPGSFVALVGPSGCGKSTVLQLLERFYSPSSGSITLDGVDVSTLNIAEYRANMALVQQEPVLYSGTLRFNIALGATDPSTVTDEAILKAAADANIAEFITSLPEGLDTDIGEHGTQLSGGQRQRIAIARALLRNPRILLLDEATAALDSASERAVQAALDAAREGRTVIAIAHRLSTIQHADVIFVFNRGVVVEKGTHEELMAAAGDYFNLVKLQNVAANAE